MAWCNMLWGCGRLDERPAGRRRIKDDGILDCLLHYAGQGHTVVLCTLDGAFALRTQVWRSLQRLCMPSLSFRVHTSHPSRGVGPETLC